MNYKLTIYPALEAGNPSIGTLYETEKEMQTAHTACANLLIFLQDNARVMEDYSNMFVIEQKIDGEWIELDE